MTIRTSIDYKPIEDFIVGTTPDSDDYNTCVNLKINGKDIKTLNAVDVAYTNDKYYQGKIKIKTQKVNDVDPQTISFENTDFEYNMDTECDGKIIFPTNFDMMIFASFLNNNDALRYGSGSICGHRLAKNSSYKKVRKDISIHIETNKFIYRCSYTIINEHGNTNMNVSIEYK
jgi:hypothetical protein